MFSKALNKRLLREMKELNTYGNGNDNDNNNNNGNQEEGKSIVIKQLQLIYPFDGDILPKTADSYHITRNTPYLKIKIDKNDLIVNVDKDYPFKPPVLLINNIHYNKRYKISDKDMLEELFHRFKFHCLCCETVMCSGRGLWSPARHISHILDEYKHFKLIKQYLSAYKALLCLNMYNEVTLPPEMIMMISDYLFKLYAAEATPNLLGHHSLKWNI